MPISFHQNRGGAADSLLRAYEIVRDAAAGLIGGDNKAFGYRLLARAALVSLAREESSIEAASLARDLAEELERL